MKKILVIAAVLAALVIANFVYDSLSEDDGKSSVGKAAPENKPGEIKLPPGNFGSSRGKYDLSTAERAQSAKKEYCARALKRMFSKGRTINVLEYRQMAKLQKRDDVRSYYNCKAVEDLNPRWCEPLKWQEDDSRPNGSYNRCTKMYSFLIILRYLVMESDLKMSLDKLDTELRNREDPFRDEIMHNARLIMSDDLDDCNKVIGQMDPLFCRILKTGTAPQVDEGDSNFYIHSLLYLIRAVREKNIQILNEMSSEDDNRFLFKGTICTEPYCDSVFEQLMSMRCYSYF